MNPLLKLSGTEPVEPAELLARYPALARAIESGKTKISKRCRFETDALIADLRTILDDWCQCQTRRITSIGWASPNDPVPPEFAIDMLGNRLCERLTEIRFEQFLNRLAESALSLDAHERRSQ
jgi:hypothetical protein